MAEVQEESTRVYQTPTELRAQMQLVRNRVQCVISDQWANPVPLAEAYLREARPLRERLQKLRDRHAHAAETILYCERQALKFEAKLRAVNNEVLVRRALALAERLNECSVDLKSTEGQLAAAVREDLRHLVERVHADQLNRDHARDYRCFVRGFAGEAADLRSLLRDDSARFRREEADLLSRLAVLDRNWDRFAESVVHRDEILDGCYVELERLQALLQDAEGKQQVKKAEAGVGELSELLSKIAQEDSKTAQQLVNELTRVLLQAAGKAVAP